MLKLYHVSSHNALHIIHLTVGLNMLVPHQGNSCCSSPLHLLLPLQFSINILLCPAIKANWLLLAIQLTLSISSSLETIINMLASYVLFMYSSGVLNTKRT